MEKFFSPLVEWFHEWNSQLKISFRIISHEQERHFLAAEKGETNWEIEESERGKEEKWNPPGDGDDDDEEKSHLITARGRKFHYELMVLLECN